MLTISFVMHLFLCFVNFWLVEEYMFRNKKSLFTSDGIILYWWTIWKWWSFSLKSLLDEESYTCSHSCYSGLNRSFVKSSSCVVYDNDYSILYKLNLSKRRICTLLLFWGLFKPHYLQLLKQAYFQVKYFSQMKLFSTMALTIFPYYGTIRKRMTTHDLIRFDSFLQSNHFFKEWCILCNRIFSKSELQEKEYN